MMFANRRNQSVSLIGIMLLSLMLVCAQGSRLHIHFLDCEHPSNPASALTVDADPHPPHAKIHLVTQDVHVMHASDGLSELDISPQGLLQKSPAFNMLMPLILSLFIFIGPIGSDRVFPLPRCRGGIVHWRYTLSPPLRAPPTN
jgi:hypothetical protein